MRFTGFSMARPDIGSGDTDFACVRVQLKTPAKKKIRFHRQKIDQNYTVFFVTRKYRIF